MTRPYEALLAELPTVREGGIDAAEFRGSASDARSRLGTHAFAQARTQHRTGTVPEGLSWPVLLIRQPAGARSPSLDRVSSVNGPFPKLRP